MKSAIAREMLKKFPETSLRTLAKKLHEENSLIFKDSEDARVTLRYCVGSLGDANRKNLGSKIIERIPKTYSKPIEDYYIQGSNILLISDLHLPYHDVQAVTLALEYGLEQGCDTCVINGDLLDFHFMSRFEKDIRKRSTKQEFESALEFLELVSEMFTKVVWIEGNHDARYEKWLMTNAPQLFDDEYFRLEERLKLKELNIDFVYGSSKAFIGSLIVTHGHNLIRGVFAPVNAARGVFLRAKTSAIIGHVHQVSEHTEKDLNGKIITCWSTGCLCTLNPEYDPLNTKHSHGFAHVQTDGKNFHVKNYRIDNGVIL